MLILNLLTTYHSREYSREVSWDHSQDYCKILSMFLIFQEELVFTPILVII